MSVTASILVEIALRGVTVRVEGDTLRLRPRVALDDDFLARIKEHKPEIICAIRDEGSHSMADDEYSGRFRAALFENHRWDFPAGLILWLRRCCPILYIELTERLPDKIQKLWETHAPVEEFQNTLDTWLEAHKAGREVYEEHLQRSRDLRVDEVIP